MAFFSAPAWLKPLLTRKMLICLFTGFSSGLPLYLLIQLIPIWLQDGGVDIKVIGFAALTQLPFTWKFFWAPFMDRFAPPLGRRRGWMWITQIGLLLSIGALGSLRPDGDLSNIMALSTLIAVFAASQDVALDAFRREILADEELGPGNAMHVNAYRISGLIPGSLALVLADHLPWTSVFWITAFFMLPGLFLTLCVSEPVTPGQPRTLRAACVEPLLEFLRRVGWQGALLMLAFLFLYKLGDSMATALASPFYRTMGFSKEDVGLVAKHAGLWPMLIGGMAGAVIMVKIGINRALWVFGAVQMITILGFAWLAAQGPFPAGRLTEAHYASLAAVISAEYLGVGLGTAAFTAFIARATHPAYTAAQFALFTSLTAAPRTLCSAFAGVLVAHLGWSVFFLFCTALAVPGMLLLFKVAPWREKEESRTALVSPS
ncbi:MAG: AmpG family muropeptide MFS transporter [Zoogloeaceae bacterium]|jgi:PAT family beta-lactamase induction signal transducer AmpG|nr:AmpG family muropeptide MFS transporter [Zoogloeaceae bacterium]